MLPVAVPPERLEDLERHVGVRRVLHVDADEEPGRLGALEDPAQVVDGARPVDVEAELRQLQRDVAPDAGRDRSPRSRRGTRASPRRPRRGSRRSRRGGRASCVKPRASTARAASIASSTVFAGDEPAGEARRLAHAVARRQRLEGPAAGEEVEEGLRRAIEHQCVRPGVHEQVLDRPRVVAQHGALADAEPSALGDDDAARLERLGGLLDRLPCRSSRRGSRAARRAPRSVDRCAVSRSRRVIDGRMAAAKTAVGSTLYSAPMRARTSRASSSTSRARLDVASPATGIGAPNVTNARDR